MRTRETDRHRELILKAKAEGAFAEESSRRFGSGNSGVDVNNAVSCSSEIVDEVAIAIIGEGVGW
jgi:hypothetical protein